MSKKPFFSLKLKKLMGKLFLYKNNAKSTFMECKISALSVHKISRWRPNSGQNSWHRLSPHIFTL